MPSAPATPAYPAHPAYPACPAYPAYPRQRHPRGVRRPAAEEAAPAEDDRDEPGPDPHAVQRYSILEHTIRRLLLEALSGTPEDEPDPEQARELLCRWEDQQREGQRQTIALGVTHFNSLYLVLAEELAVQVVVADSRLLRSQALRAPAVRALSNHPASPAAR